MASKITITPNILTIKYVERPKSSLFLELPRELRDLIYWYALVEPRKWDKRHNSSCPYYNPLAGGEEPPFRYNEGANDPYYGNPKTSEIMRQCHNTCVRRKCLGLLRANRQIHEEASPILWDENTFCFDLPYLFCMILDSIPHSVRSKIQKISFMSSLPYTGICARQMFEILAEVQNLVELEVSREILETCGEYFIALRNLEYVRVVSCRAEAVHNERDSTVAVMGLMKRFRMPKCDSTKHFEYKVGNGPFRSCVPCQMVLHGFREKANWLADARTEEGVFWNDEVRHQLKLRQLSQRGHAPCVLSVRLEDGLKYKVNVWGLPVNGPAVRERRRRRTKLAERVEGKTWSSGHVPIRTVHSDEEEEPEAYNSRTGKHYQHRSQREEEAQDINAHQRLEKRDLEARREIARQKAAEKKAVKDRVKAEEETRAQRKAAQTRSGKRASS